MKRYMLILNYFLVISTVNAMSVHINQELFYGDHNEELHGTVVVLGQDGVDDNLDDIQALYDVFDSKPDKRCKLFLLKLCMLKKVPVKFIHWLLGGSNQPLVCGDGESEILIDNNDDIHKE